MKLLNAAFYISLLFASYAEAGTGKGKNKSKTSYLNVSGFSCSSNFDLEGELEVGSITCVDPKDPTKILKTKDNLVSGGIDIGTYDGPSDNGGLQRQSNGNSSISFNIFAHNSDDLIGLGPWAGGPVVLNIPTQKGRLCELTGLANRLFEKPYPGPRIGGVGFNTKTGEAALFLNPSLYNIGSLCPSGGVPKLSLKIAPPPKTVDPIILEAYPYYLKTFTKTHGLGKNYGKNVRSQELVAKIMKGEHFVKSTGRTYYTRTGKVRISRLGGAVFEDVKLESGIIATKAPNGLLWGPISNFGVASAIARGKYSIGTICSTEGGRLPTVKELIDLRKSLTGPDGKFSFLNSTDDSYILNINTESFWNYKSKYGYDLFVLYSNFASATEDENDWTSKYRPAFGLHWGLYNKHPVEEHKLTGDFAQWGATPDEMTYSCVYD